uniref:Uncharacterized protein n=1 Tax=Timema poppense TaxID=170557 RepID=A0A7R9HDT8_TIMPO|nr:unnamed protein product [Timema poppensis]
MELETGLDPQLILWLSLLACAGKSERVYDVADSLFTEYARQALGEDVERPFQKLQLLVRDWATPHLALFGPEGGKQLFNHLMQVISMEFTFTRKTCSSVKRQEIVWF